jgi:predicted XRE-type DNA-binding protein
MSDNDQVSSSSGNVFADLGLPNSEELLAKAELIRQIGQLIEERGLTQTESAQLLGTTQPKVSDLLHGRLSGFSIERLIRFLKALDHDVDIVVKRKPRTRTHARVRVSAH